MPGRLRRREPTPPRPAARRKPATPRGTGRGSGGAPVERLRAICLALPETTEKLAWGEPTWRVRGRLFAQLDDHHHGADHLAVWLPAPLGEQEAMIFTDPARFFRPPYVGHRGWVGVRIDRRPDWALVATLVEQAYREVAPPRLREAVGAAARVATERGRRALRQRSS
jgi:hypothetical protein